MRWLSSGWSSTLWPRSSCESLAACHSARLCSPASLTLPDFAIRPHFSELTAPHASAVLLDHGVSALRKVFFDSAVGATLLPDVLPYASAALHQAAPAPLRRLAVQLLAQLAVSDAERRGAGTEQLLAAVGDEDTGVALEAERGLRALAAAPNGLDLLLGRQQARLRGMAASADPVLRARALALLLGLASASPVAAAAVHDAGLLSKLVEELGRAEDLLSCMAALQLVEGAAAQCDAGMAAALGEAVGCQLAGLLRHEEPLLRCAALQAAAALVALSLERGPAGMDADAAAALADAPGLSPAASAQLDQALFAALKSSLDVSSQEEVLGEEEEAALDAVSMLSHGASGAAVLLLQPGGVASDVAYKALGRPPSPAVRMAALHALAALAGTERAASGSRAAALLPPAAEDALRAAACEGAVAGGCASPAAALLRQLQQPFLEHRVAAYRCLSALLLRAWAAAEACTNGELLDLLLDPRTETGLQGCEWRHACVAALAATLRAETAATGAAATGAANGFSAHHTIFREMLPRVDAAARAGPFGAGQAAPAEHLVATVSGT